MIPNLPRPFLWTEIETLDKFFLEEPVTLGLYHIITESLSELDEKIDAIKLFNEMFYQLTRIYYEESTSVDYPKYVNDIKANLGWSFSADLVMVMIYTYIRIKDKDCPPSAAMLMECIKMNQSFKPYWKRFRYFRYNIMGYPHSSISPKVPHPVPTRMLPRNYVNFYSITQGYQIDLIKDLLALWKDENDKRQVARLISIRLKYFSRHGNNRYGDTITWLKNYLDIKDTTEHRISMCAEESISYNAGRATRKENVDDDFENEKAALLKKIEELEQEKERLETLLNKHKDNKGKNRKFTLVQIADYSKNCVEWNDVKYIVAMLNKLIRDDADKEENEIVDSIEEEFKKRIGGSTFNEKVGQVIQHADKVIM